MDKMKLLEERHQIAKKKKLIKALEKSNGDKDTGNEVIEDQELMENKLDKSKDKKSLKERDKIEKKYAAAIASTSCKDCTSSTSNNVFLKFEYVQFSKVSQELSDEILVTEKDDYEADSPERPK